MLQAMQITTAAAKRIMQNHWSSLRAFRNRVICFLCQHRKALTLEIPKSRAEAEAAISLPPSTKEQTY